MRKKRKLSAVCAVLSLYTLLVFHFPFFRHAAGQLEGGFNAVFIIASLVVLMLAANYFFYYLLLRLGRGVGRAVIAFSLVADAVSIYFIKNFDVMLDATMMGNVFNTRYSEASGFFSWGLVAYVLLLGVLPAVYICVRRIDFGSWKRFFAHIGVSLGILVALVFSNMSNWPWIDRNSTTLGSLILPWSYTVNTVRYHNKERERNREPELLPDAQLKNDGKRVFVLVIGESARRDHFSLYGYERQTNPLLEGDDIKAFPALSAATYTTAGVKAILDYEPTRKLCEPLPSYLHRVGADVVWRSSNWGEAKLHVDKYQNVSDLKKLYPEADGAYDGILLEGLSEEILSSEKDNVFIVLHTSTSHGPNYNKRYPAEFEKFTPVCTTVEMSKADHGELMNSYDNSILYTDWLIHSVIETLRRLPQDWKSGLIYVSDHGESLGENNLYMHGVPMAMAPREQVEIPFIAWTSDGPDAIGDFDELGQYHVFHSVMGFFGAESEVYKPEMDIFRHLD